MDTLDAVRVMSRTSFAGGEPAVPTRPGATARVGAVRRRSNERWSSTLSPRDLRCLLAVLEDEAIPALVAGYAPARAAPLAAPD